MEEVALQRQMVAEVQVFHSLRLRAEAVLHQVQTEAVLLQVRAEEVLLQVLEQADELQEKEAEGVVLQRVAMHHLLVVLELMEKAVADVLRVREGVVSLQA